MPAVRRGVLLIGIGTALALAVVIPIVASVASAAPEASTPATLVTKRPVAALAADGGRAALVIPGRGADPARRWQILVWEPASHRLLTIHTERDAYPGEGVALAGTRVAWDDCSSCYGNTLTTRVSSATLARRSAVSLGSDDGTEVPSGGEVLAPSGDGKLLAYTDQQRCDESGETTLARRAASPARSSRPRSGVPHRADTARRASPTATLAVRVTARASRERTGS